MGYRGKHVRLSWFAGLVHVDYTAKGGPNRLRMVLPEEADKLSKTPYAIVQVRCFGLAINPMVKRAPVS